MELWKDDANFKRIEKKYFNLINKTNLKYNKDFKRELDTREIVNVNYLQKQYGFSRYQINKYAEKMQAIAPFIWKGEFPIFIKRKGWLLTDDVRVLQKYDKELDKKFVMLDLKKMGLKLALIKNEWGIFSKNLENNYNIIDDEKKHFKL